MIDIIERIKKKNDAEEDLDIKPGDVKYLYVVLENEGYQQEITKGIYFSKEKDCFNMTWYIFSIIKDTIIVSVSPVHIFDTKEQIEYYVDRQVKEEAMDKINPEHYKSKIQAIEVIEEWDLSFCLGNCVKYIARAGKKEGSTTKEDLEKAIWYLQRELSKIT